MAIFKVTNTKKAVKSVNKEINNAISRSGAFNKAHEILREQIREGINPKTGKPYKALRPVTIDRRKKLAQTNPTHPKYSANKANHTLTGSLLDGLFTRFNKAKGQITISIRGKHEGYASATGRLIKGSRKSRIRIVEAQEENGRQILSVSNKLIEEIRKRIIKALRRL